MAILLGLSDFWKPTKCILYGNNRFNLQIRSQERSLDQMLTPDDRFTPSGTLCPRGAGGAFILFLHLARLADCRRGHTLGAVIRSSPKGPRGRW